MFKEKTAALNAEDVKKNLGNLKSTKSLKKHILIQLWCSVQSYVQEPAENHVSVKAPTLVKLVSLTCLAADQLLQMSHYVYESTSNKEDHGPWLRIWFKQLDRCNRSYFGL